MHSSNRYIVVGQNGSPYSMLGQTYAQAPFGYQRKCLAALQRRFAALSNSSLDQIGPVLEETGCLPYFSR